MSVPYYIGARAIAERLGYRSPNTVYRLILREQLPVYKRAVRGKCRGHQALAISESVLTAWELAKGREFTNFRRGQVELRKEAERNGLLPRKRGRPRLMPA